MNLHMNPANAEPIRSVNNPRVKAWAALQQKKGRDETGLFLVEGAHLAAEALRSGFEVTEVLYVPGASAAEVVRSAAARAGRGGVPWIAVSEAVMQKIADTRTPQGVAAVVRKREPDLDELLAAAGERFRTPNGLAEPWGGPWVALDAVQDPGNLGTILRSADAAGAAGVLVGHGSADLYNPKTIRACMGSLFRVPAVYCDLREALPRLKAAGVKVFAALLSPSARSCYEADLAGPVCFVLGNEGAGVSPDAAALADEAVVIPMRGGAESLNVAMAATVLLFEALRRREVSPNKNSCPRS